jgi:predicted DNA-binding transcriptional regulator AlpA
MKQKRILINKKLLSDRIEFTTLRIKQKEQTDYGVTPGEDKIPVLLKPSEVIELFGISKKTLYNYEKQGILKPKKLGAKSRFKYYVKDDILNAINSMQ